jgi:large subunit ribosomal protein L23
MFGEGKYSLKVARTATKGDLKHAVSERYGVDVVDVHIMNMPSKQRRRGATIGVKSGFKKAIITLAKGQIINEF